MKIESSIYVSDYDTVERTWVERLFTLPWTPWVGTKVVEARRAFICYGHTVIVSVKTYQDLKRAGVL